MKMEPTCTVDPYNYLNLVRNSDGSIKRLYDIPTTAAAPDPTPTSLVLSKDLQLNTAHATWLRLYLPRQPGNPSAAVKLPIIVYFHGGGFIFFSAASASMHDFCSAMALDLNAIVVSVEYRLAPEHRLPAAYDDAADALRWLRKTEDEWLTRFADLSNCFLMGGSAGGNLAYHAGLRAAAEAGELVPLKIRGLILQQPFFGGSKRTDSEIRLVDDPILPLSAADLMWDLSLPIGADRDHEYCNPTARKGDCDQFKKIREAGCRILFSVGDTDPLVDKQKAAAEMVKREGVAVELVIGKGDGHGAELGDIANAKALFGVIKRFIG